jgi:hypothetical protein
MLAMLLVPYFPDLEVVFHLVVLRAVGYAIGLAAVAVVMIAFVVAAVVLREVV